MPARRVQFLDAVEPTLPVGKLTFIHYTDPYSIWCWGAQPIVRGMEHLYAGQVEVEYRIGGLFEDFTPVLQAWERESKGKWKDSVLDFLEGVSERCAMPFDRGRVGGRIGNFRSTFPACIVAKAGFLQGKGAGARFLRVLREAIELRGLNVEEEATQTSLAREAGLDADALTKAMSSGAAKKAFEADRVDCRAQGIDSFPTFVLKRGQVRLQIDGYHPWEHFAEALRKLAPDLRPREIRAGRETVTDALRRYGPSATRELAIMLASTDDDIEILMDDLIASESVMRRPAGRSVMWELAG